MREFLICATRGWCTCSTQAFLEGRTVAILITNFLKPKPHTAGLNGLLLWIKLFKYISITASLVRVLRAMTKSVKVSLATFFSSL